MREKNLEAKAKREAKKIGAECLKMVCPEHAGATDRMFMAPFGLIWFVEFKRPGGKLSPLQIVFKKTIEKLGHKHRVVDSDESLNKFLQEVKDAMICDRPDGWRLNKIVDKITK